MNDLNKYFRWQFLIYIPLLIFISFIIIMLILNIDISKSIRAILQVDSEKQMSLILKNSNINLISESKNLTISIEGKMYILNDVEFVYMGNDIYNIKFTNNDLYHLLKTNSTYNVNLLLGSKKIIDFIFNI